LSKWVPTIAVAAVVTVCLMALYRLLLLQFDAGDAYPPYSSYRADPLGLLIFHEAMDAASDRDPMRNLTPLESATFPEDSTLLLAGASISEDDVSTLKRLEDYIAAGGRMVVLFRADQSANARQMNEDKEEKERDENEKSDEKDSNDSESAEERAKARQERAEEMMNTLMPRADISERWGFGYVTRNIPDDADTEHVVEVQRAEAAPAALPERVEWHSETAFTDLAPEWKAIYQRNGRPVVIERPWGTGSIVVASDNYLVSNEAMREDRTTAYLAWLAGPGRTLIFEETHLGVARSTGVMTLARRYGLIPVLLVGVLLALLFIWRNAVPLVPRRTAARTDHAVAASQSTVAGLASLVRRAVRSVDILETGWRLYLAPAMRRSPIDAKSRAAVEAALESYRATPARRRDPVATYNHINAIINERKPKT
jgi:hypothetical protein